MLTVRTAQKRSNLMRACGSCSMFFVSIFCIFVFIFLCFVNISVGTEENCKFILAYFVGMVDVAMMGFFCLSVWSRFVHSNCVLGLAFCAVIGDVNDLTCFSSSSLSCIVVVVVFVARSQLILSVVQFSHFMCIYVRVRMYVYIRLTFFCGH